MTIYIAGGSNSLMKTGWVSYFARQHDDVVNLSVGANTTLVGLYRAMTTPEIRAGDVLIWEYALNDANHLGRGYSAKLLLRYLEHLIRYCGERGIKFAPVIFTPSWIEAKPARLPYYHRLHALLRRYRLPPFDMSLEYREALGVTTLPESLFEDTAHYAHSDEVLGFIAEGAARAVAEARVPARMRPEFVGYTRMALVEDFTDTTFENSVMKVASRHPPVTTVAPVRGALEAVFFVTTQTPSAISVDIGAGSDATRLNLSTTTWYGASKVKRLLKSANLRVAAKGPVEVRPKTPLAATMWNGTGPLYTEVFCEAEFGAPDPQADVHVTGFMIETRPLAERLGLARLEQMARHVRRRLRR